MEYIFFISAQIFVPLITISPSRSGNIWHPWMRFTFSTLRLFWEGLNLILECPRFPYFVKKNPINWYTQLLMLCDFRIIENDIIGYFVTSIDLSNTSIYNHRDSVFYKQLIMILVQRYFYIVQSSVVITDKHRVQNAFFV